MLFVDSLHMTARKTASVFYKPEVVISIIENTRRITSIGPNYAARKEPRMNDRITTADLGKQKALARLRVH
jgi:hypothetical protein